MFSENLKKYRNINKLTQDELALKMYVSRTLITKWEVGNVTPTKEHILKLCEVFDTSIRKLLSRKEIKEILLKDYKKKFIEILFFSLAIILLVVSVTLFIFSIYLENTLTNQSNIIRIIPTTRKILITIFVVSAILFLLKLIISNKNIYKYIYQK